MPKLVPCSLAFFAIRSHLISNISCHLLSIPIGTILCIVCCSCEHISQVCLRKHLVSFRSNTFIYLIICTKSEPFKYSIVPHLAIVFVLITMSDTCQFTFVFSLTKTTLFLNQVVMAITICGTQTCLSKALQKHRGDN